MWARVIGIALLLVLGTSLAVLAINDAVHGTSLGGNRLVVT
jgi:hypothetical protein